MLNRQHTRRHRTLPNLVAQACCLCLPLLLPSPTLAAQPTTNAPKAATPAAPTPTHPPLSTYSKSTINGFQFFIDPTSEKSNPLRHRRLLAAITFDLDIIIERIPAPALAVLRQTPIVLTTVTEPFGSWKGHGCCYHASAGWLTANGYDKEREGVVEVLNADDYLQWRAEQPMMLLHELAHAYHARLDVNRPDLRAALEHAKAAHLYGPVPHALNAPDNPRDAYAANNPTEYFSELTEAFFGRNDFFPFTNAELKTYDPEGFALVDKLWHLSETELANQLKADLRPNP